MNRGTRHNEPDALSSSPESASINAQLRAELNYLTALTWAPDPALAVHAIVGDLDYRSDPTNVDRIPLDHTLFLASTHTAIFRAVVDLVDDGLPVSPSIVSTRTPKADYSKLEPVLLHIASPPGRPPLPGGAEVPHLARALVDAHHRRGYAALVASMALALEEKPMDDLADHWAMLTHHQLSAEKRRRSILAALADL